MNYKRIYKQIIKKAKHRDLDGYKERHHIKPKCLGGSNEGSNLVYLTAKEHFICHRLLCKIYPNNHSLIAALWLMVNAARDYQKRYIPSARIYESLRIDFSIRQSIAKKGVKREKWVCDKLSKGMLGKKKSKQHIKNISKAKMGEGNHMFGKFGKDNPKSKPLKQYDLEGNFIRDWESCSVVARELGFSQGNINSCAKGKTKTACGFKWKFS
jgi:hypothetical protein